MRIKIISDGTCRGTRVVNVETGEVVDNVTEISWGIVGGGTAMTTLKIYDVHVELAGTVAPLPPRREDACREKGEH